MLLLTFEWWSENSSLRKFKFFFTVTNKLDVILMFNIELSQEKNKTLDYIETNMLQRNITPKLLPCKQ